MQPLTYEITMRCRIEQIMNLFNRAVTVQHAEIKKACNMHPATTSRTMNMLIRCGLVTRVMKGTYQLGFDPFIKPFFKFKVDCLEAEPNTVMAKQVGNKTLFFWVSSNKGIENLQAFGAFSNYAGQIVRKVERDKDGRIKWPTPPKWFSRVMSYCIEKISSNS